MAVALVKTSTWYQELQLCIEEAVRPTEKKWGVRFVEATGACETSADHSGIGFYSFGDSSLGEGMANLNAADIVPIANHGAGGGQSVLVPSLVMCVGIAANTALPVYLLVCLQWLDVGADNDPSFWARVLTFMLDNYDQYVAKIVQYGLGGTAIGLAMQVSLKEGSWTFLKLLGLGGMVFSVLAMAVAIYVLFQFAPGGEFESRMAEVPYSGPLKALGPVARAAALQSVDTMVLAVTGAIGFSTWKIGK